MAIDKHAFEDYPPGMPMDETDINLRAYFALMDDAKLAEYDPAWSDERLMEWDGNFKNDGTLMLICSEREVDVEEYRETLDRYFKFRAEAGEPIAR